MLRTFLHSKIHRATVTDAQAAYEGSITLDPILIEAANMQLYEKVLVVNINNGERFETYIIEGERGEGTVCLNGAAARLAIKGDKVIIMSFFQAQIDELRDYDPIKIHVGENNEILSS